MFCAVTADATSLARILDLANIIVQEPDGTILHWILFTSGYAEPAIARLGQKKGAWLKKPYTADELADKVRKVLEEPTK